jgi:hypothetical protein
MWMIMSENSENGVIFIHVDPALSFWGDFGPASFEKGKRFTTKEQAELYIREMVNMSPESAEWKRQAISEENLKNLVITAVLQGKAL